MDSPSVTHRHGTKIVSAPAGLVASLALPIPFQLATAAVMFYRRRSRRRGQKHSVGGKTYNARRSGNGA
jgi:hypothetical protein